MLYCENARSMGFRGTAKILTHGDTQRTRAGIWSLQKRYRGESSSTILLSSSSRTFRLMIWLRYILAYRPVKRSVVECPFRSHTHRNESRKSEVPSFSPTWQRNALSGNGWELWFQPSWRRQSIHTALVAATFLNHAHRLLRRRRTHNSCLVSPIPFGGLGVWARFLKCISASDCCSVADDVSAIRSNSLPRSSPESSELLLLVE